MGYALRCELSVAWVSKHKHNPRLNMDCGGEGSPEAVEGERAQSPRGMNVSHRLGSRKEVESIRDEEQIKE